MAWTAKTDRFSSAGPGDGLGPGKYLAHTSYEAETHFAPFGSSAVHITSSKDVATVVPKDAQNFPAPGAYNPKLPGSHDSGLPRKYTPFMCGTDKLSSPLKKHDPPGPGAYQVVPQLEKAQSCRTMGAPQAGGKVVFRSASAPSIPRDHQCYGYEERGDGRLVRQGRREGSRWMSGIHGDNAGPGHYDFKKDALRPRALGGRFLQGDRGSKVTSDTPAPCQYEPRQQASQFPMYSSFASQAQRGPSAKDKLGPGPGQYSADVAKARPDLREVRAELQYFGSTAERFKGAKAENNPGPGSYAGRRGQAKVGGIKSFNATADRFQGNDPTKVTRGPGPGEYDTQTVPSTSGPLGTTSILGSTGSLAFGSMESKRGINTKTLAPGPGAYKYDSGFEEEELDVGSGGKHAKRKTRKQPGSVFKSGTAKDVMTLAVIKSGQSMPPPGAYDPVHATDVAAVMRLPPKHEGFLSSKPRQQDMKAATAPGPGRYNAPTEINGGKRIGSFNRTVVEGVPTRARAGMGFTSQAGRFGPIPGDTGGPSSMPGPGAYNVEPGWVTKTHNVHFGADW